VNQSDHRNLATVRRCDNSRQAEQYALVLAAMGVPSSLEREGNFTNLCVAHKDVAKANHELTAYDSENHKRLSETKLLHPPLPRLEIAIAYWAVLLFFFAAASNNAFSFDWVGEGAAQAGTMIRGEWWRTVTALSLHVSTTHLLGNLVFGTAFLLLLTQVTGAGVAYLAMVAGGAAGNAINALVQLPTHTSIGASTAIFAGLGLLATLQQIRRASHSFFTLRDGAPLVGGIALLAFLGFSGENTDILAHILGFGSGIATGWVLTRWNHDWPANRSLQWKCASTAGVIMAGAWFAAIFA
jgi:rhomboid protease GluP